MIEHVHKKRGGPKRVPLLPDPGPCEVEGCKRSRARWYSHKGKVGYIYRCAPCNHAGGPEAFREIARRNYRKKARPIYGPKPKPKNRSAKTYRKFKKNSCEACGFEAFHSCQLDVDHLDGDRHNNDPSNLQTLCANCHRMKTIWDVNS